MKKIIFAMLFVPFIGFAQTQYDALDCSASDVIKEIYQDGNNTVVKCTDNSGAFYLYVAPPITTVNNGGGGDTEMSEDPGREWMPQADPTCINTWIRIWQQDTNRSSWQLVNYCG